VSIPLRRYASHIALVSSIHEPSSYLEERRCDTYDVDSGVATNVSIAEYKDRVDGFSWIERVAHDVTLTLGFFWMRELT
jgi:hypothetical protein